MTAKATEFTSAPRVRALAFDYGNRFLFGAACQHAQSLGSEICLLAVWDGRPGEGAGGTADYLRMVREVGRPAEVIFLPGATEPALAPRSFAAESPIV